MSRGNGQAALRRAKAKVGELEQKLAVALAANDAMTVHNATALTVQEARDTAEATIAGVQRAVEREAVAMADVLTAALGALSGLKIPESTSDAVLADVIAGRDRALTDRETAMVAMKHHADKAGALAAQVREFEALRDGDGIAPKWLRRESGGVLAHKILNNESLTDKDHKLLRRIFRWIDEVAVGYADRLEKDARDALELERAAEAAQAKADALKADALKAAAKAGDALEEDAAAA